MVPTMLIAVLDHPDCATRDLSSAADDDVRRLGGAGGAGRTGSSSGFGVPVQHPVRADRDARRDQPDPASPTRPRTRPTTVGQPLPELEVKIADPVTGEVAADRRAGRDLLPRLPEHARRTSTARRRPRRRSTPTAGCTWATSAPWTSAATCQVTGRLKDMIIRGGDQHLPARDRGAPVRPPGDRRGRRHRRARREVGRAGRRRDPARGRRPHRRAGRTSRPGAGSGSPRTRSRPSGSSPRPIR